VIGGWAAALHGSARTTLDVDVVMADPGENIRALVAALQPHDPYLRVLRSDFPSPLTSAQFGWV
jgi:hypothetical protein